MELKVHIIPVFRMFNLVYVHATRQTGKMVRVMNMLRIRSTKHEYRNLVQMGKVHVQRDGSSSLLFLPPPISLPLLLPLCVSVSVSVCVRVCVCVFTCVQVSLVVCTCGC